jgi:mono/diheme cytochrome c family protein
MKIRNLLVIGTLLGVAGCSRKPATPTTAPARPPTAGSTTATATDDQASSAIPTGTYQGLTASERDRFYHLTMGSELFPLDWFHALESKQTGKPFLEDPNRFGLIADPNDPDGLPIGMTAMDSPDLRLAGRMVGLNCAACHTGELTYKGKSIRIDGGSSLIDVTALFTDLIQSIAATFEDSEKLLAFISRLHARRESQQGDSPRNMVQSAQRLVQHLVAEESSELKESVVPRIKELFAKAKAHKPIDLASAVKDAKASADNLRTHLLEDFDGGDLRELIEESKLAQSPLATIADAAVRESVLRQTLEDVYVTARLLKGRAAFLHKLGALRERNLPTTAAGPGRVDDFGNARNLLLDVEYARPTTAPCSISHLWGTSHLQWSDWDNNTTSSLGRSMATALAGGAAFDPDSFHSTVPPRNLFELDELSRKITAPVWPEAVFGKIDPVKAERGGELFKQHCVRCHVTESGPLPDLLYDLDEVGTDPRRALNFAENAGDRPYADALRDVIGSYMNRAYEQSGIDAAEAAKMESGRPNQWRPTGKYGSRPLRAIWATAPYLHNGSVPTLHDLLRPADQRPKSFPVGQREYDPVKLGFVTELDGVPKFLFDTSQEGNANIGHEFGTDLSEEDRVAMLEYLKRI